MMYKCNIYTKIHLYVFFLSFLSLKNSRNIWLHHRRNDQTKDRTFIHLYMCLQKLKDQKINQLYNIPLCLLHKREKTIEFKILYNKIKPTLLHIQ